MIAMEAAVNVSSVKKPTHLPVVGVRSNRATSLSGIRRSFCSLRRTIAVWTGKSPRDRRRSSVAPEIGGLP
jgi:hypothetical protein